MPQRTATIERLPMAFEVVKQMQADGLEWCEGYRPLCRRALAKIIEGRMAAAVDGWLDGSAVRDRRNGSYSRHLLTELGDIELAAPRSRRFCPTGVLRAYARRSAEIDRAILAGFVLGLSTRKVGEALLALLGRPVSAATVCRVVRTLDATVAAFHARPLANAYKALMLNGVVLARRTGAGTLRRPVLVALGIRPDGRKKILDFRHAASESAVEWERFLTDLYRRGLTGAGIEAICANGGQDLIAALPTVYPGIPLQRCCLTRTRSGGPQDQGRPRQGPQGRPRRRHERRRPPQGTQRRAALRRRPGADLSQGRSPACATILQQAQCRLSTNCSHASSTQIPCRAQAGQNDQRHRTALPESPATDTWRRGTSANHSSNGSKRKKSAYFLIGF